MGKRKGKYPMKNFLVYLRRLPRRLTVISILGAALCFAIPSTALAATSQASTDWVSCGSNVQCVIAFGDQAIMAREGALTKLSDRVNTRHTAGHISDDQANALQATVTTNQNGLAALKAKLDDETNVQAARQDVSNIYLQFRIFAVVLPAGYRQLYLDVEMHADNVMRGLASQIQQAIGSAPGSEQGQLNALYSDYKNQLSTAENQFDTAQTELPALTPANYNNNRTSYEGTLSSLKTAEQTAHTALRQAANDLHQMIHLLKNK